MLLMCKPWYSRNWEFISKWCFHRCALSNQFFKLPLIIHKLELILVIERHQEASISLDIVANMSHLSVNGINVRPFVVPFLYINFLSNVRSQPVNHLSDFIISLPSFLYNPNRHSDCSHFTFTLAFLAHDIQSSLGVCRPLEVTIVGLDKRSEDFKAGQGKGRLVWLIKKDQEDVVDLGGLR